MINDALSRIVRFARDCVVSIVGVWSVAWAHSNVCFVIPLPSVPISRTPNVRQATFVAFSRLLAIFCTFRTFCPTRCFVDKILWVYMCQTELASDRTTVKLFRVFQSSYERTVTLCSFVRATLILRRAIAFITAFYRLRIQSTDERDTRYRHCSMPRKGSALFTWCGVQERRK